MIPFQKQDRAYDDPIKKPFSLKGVFNKKWLLISLGITLSYGAVFTIGGYFVGVFDDITSFKILESLIVCILAGIVFSPIFEWTIPRIFK